jgi:hypothetical protein
MRLRLWIVGILLCVNVLARENPFFPTETLSQMPVTSNKITAYPQLERAAITLPDQARVLQEVTVTYKTLDGSLESKSIQLDHAVDWHLPLFISQSYNDSKKPSDDAKSTSTNEPMQRVTYQFISLDISSHTIHVNTKDALIRHFMMADPYRIVMDFKRDANFLSFEKKIEGTPCKEVRIGNHDGYYRVVMTLDGHYKTMPEADATGYLLTLN